MIIEFPSRIKVNINNPPEDFEEQIRQSFEDYTEGTAKAYTYQDKLAYIDRCRELLHHSESEEDCVMELMKDRFDWEVGENGTFPDESDFLSIEFMSDCFREGKTNLYAHYTNDHHKNDKIMKLLERAIEVVINFEDEGKLN